MEARSSPARQTGSQTSCAWYTAFVILPRSVTWPTSPAAPTTSPAARAMEIRNLRRLMPDGAS